MVVQNLKNLDFENLKQKTKFVKAMEIVQI